MQGLFQHLDLAMRPDGHVLINFGLIHRDNEWQGSFTIYALRE